MTDNWEDFRTEQGGGKGISFGGVGDRSQIGVIKGGRVLDVKPKQEVRDFKTKELKKTKAGRQLYQLPILLQTKEQAHPDDDGQRILYVKGLMFDAIDEALKQAGRETVEIGGELLIAYVGDRQVGDGEMRAFKAKYTPAPPQAAQNQAGVWGGQQTQTPPAADPFAGQSNPNIGSQNGAAGASPGWGQPPSTPPAGGGQWPNPGPPAQQPPAADPFAGGQQQGPPPGWGQQPPQHGYANGGMIPAGNTPPADPWGQQPATQPQQAGSLQDQWTAAGQQPPAPVDPWG